MGFESSNFNPAENNPESHYKKPPPTPEEARWEYQVAS